MAMIVLLVGLGLWLRGGELECCSSPCGYCGMHGLWRVQKHEVMTPCPGLGGT
jgi:hypothetical protein